MKMPGENIRNLFRDLFISILSNILLGGWVGKLSNRPLLGLAVGLVAVTVSIILVVALKYKRLFKLIRVGAFGYYYSFDLAENDRVYRSIKQSFCYLGISSHSILEMFKKWIDTNHTANSYSFLLMDPDSPELIKQVAFEKGVSPETDFSSLTPHMQESINSEVEATKAYINSALDMLKNLRPFKDGRLKIRLYSRFCPYWMYLFDEKTMYVGILEKGKRGQDSPALMLAKHPELASPFDLFKNSWDSLWAEAKVVV